MLSIEEALTNLAEDYANKLDTKVIDRVEEMKADDILFMARYKYRQLQRKNTQCCNWLKA